MENSVDVIFFLCVSHIKGYIHFVITFSSFSHGETSGNVNIDCITRTNVDFL